MKTFYTGPHGWTDQQSFDGTVVLTAPTGHAYVTEPHGASLYPALGQTADELDLPPPPAHAPDTDRAARMPRRRHTREQDRRDRIATERAQRERLNAAARREHQAWLAANNEPAPS